MMLRDNDRGENNPYAAKIDRVLEDKSLSQSEKEERMLDIITNAPHQNIREELRRLYRPQLEKVWKRIKKLESEGKL